tara:strand:+ start:206 stop:388 length:183 start_codon:yes stop_codon:yes gene_type:complete
LRIGDRVKVLSSGNVGTVEHVQWRSSAGICFAYISSVEIILDNGENIKIENCKLIEKIDG